MVLKTDSGSRYRLGEAKDGGGGGGLFNKGKKNGGKVDKGVRKREERGGKGEKISEGNKRVEKAIAKGERERRGRGVVKALLIPMMEIYLMWKFSMICDLHYGDRRSDMTPVLQTAANELS